MIWQFNQEQLEDALKEWMLEPEDDVNPQSATIQANIVREFLNSSTAFDHGLGHQPILNTTKVDVKAFRTGKTLWNDGFNAFINKIDRTSSPHKTNTRQWVLWRAGWDDACHSTKVSSYLMS